MPIANKKDSRPNFLVILADGMWRESPFPRPSTAAYLRQQNLLPRIQNSADPYKDLGYSDIGCFGSEIHTPNLDTLARDGARFTDCKFSSS
jgi:arylsulfatase